MTFTTPLFNQSFVTSENDIPVLVIESPDFFQSFIKDLFDAQNGFEQENIFYLDDAQIDLSKQLKIITDIFNLQINTQKNLNKLYAHLASEYFLTSGNNNYFNLCANITKFADDIIQDADFNLEYKPDLELSSILKSLDLKFVMENTSYLSSLIDYIKTYSLFFSKKLFILVNLKSFFSTQQLQEFYKFLSYNKISVMLVETVMPKETLSQEVYRIIDSDLCVIY